MVHLKYNNENYNSFINHYGFILHQEYLKWIKHNSLPNGYEPFIKFKFYIRKNISEEIIARSKIKTVDVEVQKVEKTRVIKKFDVIKDNLIAKKNGTYSGRSDPIIRVIHVERETIKTENITHTEIGYTEKDVDVIYPIYEIHEINNICQTIKTEDCLDKTKYYINISTLTESERDSVYRQELLIGDIDPCESNNIKDKIINSNHGDVTHKNDDTTSKSSVSPVNSDDTDDGEIPPDNSRNTRTQETLEEKKIITALNNGGFDLLNFIGQSDINPEISYRYRKKFLKYDAAINQDDNDIGFLENIKDEYDSD